MNSLASVKSHPFRMLRATALAASLLFPFALPGVADTSATFRDAGKPLFSFDIPDFWTLRTGGIRPLTGPGDANPQNVPQVLSLTPTVDPTVWVGFLAPPGVNSIADGRDYLSDIAPHLAFEPKPAPRRSSRINGRAAEILSGTGRRNGRLIQYSIALVQLPAGRVAIAATVVEVGSDPAFYDEINRIIGSLRVAQ